MRGALVVTADHGHVGAGGKHGSGRGVGNLVHADQSLKATGFGLQCAQREAFDLNLSPVWWVLTPAADAALVDTQRLGGGCLSAVVDGYV